MKTILSIDDDPWVLETLTLALESRGYKLLTTTTPDEALRMLREQPIDLVLVDINMPGKNGFDLYEEITAGEYPPVLFVSGCSHSLNATTDKFLKLWNEKFSDGFTDVLYKPFALDQLYTKVESLIGEGETVEHEPGG